MGLLRDIVGSAINNGTVGVNNGFSDRNRSGLIRSVRDRAVSYNSTGSWSQPPVSRTYGGGSSSPARRSENSSELTHFRSQQLCDGDIYNHQQVNETGLQARESSATSGPTHRKLPDWSNNDYRTLPPPAYIPSPGVNHPWHHDEQHTRWADTQMNHGQNGQSLQSNRFRPLVLPQITYGEVQPFLRGYSAELGRYNITLETFLAVVDGINAAILPSPENQLFQKGANVAGFFLPGAGSIALTVGQVAVGLGAAAAHSSKVSSALSEANTNLFFPIGLELFIGTSADIDSMVGINTNTALSSAGEISPEERLGYYNGLVSPLSSILPPERQGGRQDPVALLGNQVSRRNDEKKLRKAQKKLQKGESAQFDRLGKGLKWLILRQARQL